jgi:6-phosphogluconolactonase
MFGDIEVVDSVPARFAEIVVDGYKKRSNDKFIVALSGGSAAVPCYLELVKQSDTVDWSNVEIFWSDERCVPIDDERSNAGNAKRLFIDALKPRPDVFPMVCDDGADAYEFLLRTRPPIDVTHLGIGPDGHTASLFPESAALDEQQRLVILNEDPLGNNPLKRMTFTFPGIANSHHVVITVMGEKKAEIMQRISKGDDLPASHIEAPQVTWLLDAEAAQLL